MKWFRSRLKIDQRKNFFTYGIISLWDSLLKGIMMGISKDGFQRELLQNCGSQTYHMSNY